VARREFVNMVGSEGACDAMLNFLVVVINVTKVLFFRFIIGDFLEDLVVLGSDFSC